MRVNEENFVTGNEEDIEPSYVDKVLELHNNDSGAHPDIMAQTKVLCQDTKDRVDGALGKVMLDVKDEVNAAVEKYPYIGNNGNWYSWNNATQSFVDTGVKAQAIDGRNPQKGIDYFTEEDKNELRANFSEEFYLKEDADNQFVALDGYQDIFGIKTFKNYTRMNGIILRQEFVSEDGNNMARNVPIHVNEYGANINVGANAGIYQDGKRLATEEYVKNYVEETLLGGAW